MRITKFWHREAGATIEDTDQFWLDRPLNNSPIRVAWSLMKSLLLAAVPPETKYHGQTLDTTTAYELVLTDAGKIVDLSNASAVAVTIPANSAVAFPVNTRIDLNQDGAGLVTVGITTDTLRGDPVSQGQYKGLSLWKRAATEWVIYGGTTA